MINMTNERTSSMSEASPEDPLLKHLDKILDDLKTYWIPGNAPIITRLSPKEAKAQLLQIITEVRIDEVEWFIEVWDRTVKDGSYPTHAVLEDHLAELQPKEDK